MRRILGVFLCVWLAWAGGAVAFAEMPVPNRVDVYPNGARLSFELPMSGELTLNLPAAIQNDGIQYHPSDGLTIDDFEIRRVPRPGWLPPALEELKSRVDQAREKLDGLMAAKAAYQQTARHLAEFMPESIKPEDLLAHLESTQQKRMAVEEQIAQTAVEIEKAEQLHQTLLDELRNKTPRDADHVLEARVRGHGEGLLHVFAWVDDTQWTPRYRAELQPKSDQVELKLTAEVSQKSGLPWNGPLALHANQPRTGEQPVELAPLVVDFREERPPIAFRSKAMDSVQEMAAAAPAALARKSPGENAVVMEEKLTGIQYETTGSVEGSGEPTRLTLESLTLEGKSTILSIPVIRKEAWIQWEIESLPRPLPGGPIELFLEGKPAASAYIQALSRGEEMKLAFGSSPQVVATRETDVAMKGDTWTGKGEMEDGYTIKVTNGLGRAAQIKVLDRLPVSAREAIELDRVKIEPEAERDEKTGMLTWSLDLGQGETRSIRVSYRLKYPSDKELIFRNHR